MPTKQHLPKPTEPADEKGRFWQRSEKRNVISAEGRKWQEENAEAAAEWAKWVEEHGVPLRPLF
ncbi:MAG: type II toxin-antitoxin system CcdA family antitoxin [Devosia sp.]